jgi:hypothetical protein
MGAEETGLISPSFRGGDRINAIVIPDSREAADPESRCCDIQIEIPGSMLRIAPGYEARTGLK